MPGRKFMMATKAFNGSGEIDVSMPTPDLCLINAESPDYYIGSWVFGIGMFNVHFPKATTRELTDTERKYWRGRSVGTTFAGRLALEIDDERPLEQVTEGREPS